MPPQTNRWREDNVVILQVRAVKLDSRDGDIHLFHDHKMRDSFPNSSFDGVVFALWKWLSHILTLKASKRWITSRLGRRKRLFEKLALKHD